MFKHNKREPQKERETKAERKGKQDQQLETKPISCCNLKGLPAPSVCSQTPWTLRGEPTQVPQPTSATHTLRDNSELPKCSNPICPINFHFKMTTAISCGASDCLPHLPFLPVCPAHSSRGPHASHVGDIGTDNIAMAGETCHFQSFQLC